MSDIVQQAIARVRAKFLSEADLRTAPLRQLLAGELAFDDHDVIDAAHKIAGLAGSLGLADISAAAVTLEARLRGAQTADATPAIEDAVVQVLAAFEAAKRPAEAA